MLVVAEQRSHEHGGSAADESEYQHDQDCAERVAPAHAEHQHRAQHDVDTLHERYGEAPQTLTEQDGPHGCGRGEHAAGNAQPPRLNQRGRPCKRREKHEQHELLLGAEVELPRTGTADGRLSGNGRRDLNSAHFVRNSGRLGQRLVKGHGALARDEGGDARQRHLLRENCVDGATNAERILSRTSDEVDIHGVAGTDGFVVAGRDDETCLQLAPLDGANDGVAIFVPVNHERLVPLQRLDHGRREVAGPGSHQAHTQVEPASKYRAQHQDEQHGEDEDEEHVGAVAREATQVRPGDCERLHGLSLRRSSESAITDVTAVNPSKAATEGRMSPTAPPDRSPSPCKNHP